MMRPWTRTQPVNICRQRKPVKNIFVVCFGVKTRHLVDNENKFEDNKNQCIDSKQHNQAVITLAQ